MRKAIPLFVFLITLCLTAACFADGLSFFTVGNIFEWGISRDETIEVLKSLDEPDMLTDDQSQIDIEDLLEDEDAEDARLLRLLKHLHIKRRVGISRPSTIVFDSHSSKATC